jgi:hypothetical protein
MAMDASKALELELHRGDRVERFEVHGERALVGSASHCDVRIRPDEGPAELIVFELRGTALLACTRAAVPACCVAGVPFCERRIEGAVVIDVGELAIRAELIDTRIAARQRKNDALLPPQVQALLLVGLAVAAYYVLQPPPAQTLIGAAVRMPELFPERAVSCPAAEATAAQALATQARATADVKRERAPFHAGEAVLAVPLYERAAACYAVAGDEPAAAAAQKAADVLAARARDELRVRQVRLERFLALGAHDDAQQEIRVLRDLMRERSDPYAQWLSAVQREINTRFASDRGKERR